MVQAEQAVEREVNRKRRNGVVVSHGNDKTVIVAVVSAARHRLYRKVIRRTKRYPVHDPENSATTGDLVVIEECRPISKTKRWRLVEVITEREVAEVAPESIDEALVDEMQRTAARAAAEAEEAEEADAEEEATAEAEDETRRRPRTSRPPRPKKRQPQRRRTSRPPKLRTRQRQRRRKSPPPRPRKRQPERTRRPPNSRKRATAKAEDDATAEAEEETTAEAEDEPAAEADAAEETVAEERR